MLSSRSTSTASPTDRPRVSVATSTARAITRVETVIGSGVRSRSFCQWSISRTSSSREIAAGSDSTPIAVPVRRPRPALGHAAPRPRPPSAPPAVTGTHQPTSPAALPPRRRAGHQPKRGRRMRPPPRRTSPDAPRPRREAAATAVPILRCPPGPGARPALTRTRSIYPAATPAALPQVLPAGAIPTNPHVPSGRRSRPPPTLPPASWTANRVLPCPPGAVTRRTIRTWSAANHRAASRRVSSCPR